MSEPLLEVRGLEVAYGAIPAVKGVDLEVRPGEIVAVIGANGAGKTTMLAAISGLLAPRAGTVRFEGRSLAGRRADEIVRAGVVHVPEGRAILTRLTVAENLALGAYTRRDRDGVAGDLESTLARFPVLRERARQLAGTLSGGEQQMLAIGRALMARPKLLLLDEPSTGLAPLVVAEIFEMVARIRAEGTAVLLVEQNARQALRIADRAYVLETGRVVMAGPAAELAESPEVRRAYLGL
ncbi:MAG TPA: ABC transporter ATP-binding protein [Thermodesulfobacteriota bacterium]